MSAPVRAILAAPGVGAVVVSLALAGLAGCVRDGDFGRVEPSAVSQRLGLSPYRDLPGYAGTRDRALPLSEAEQDLRAHAYSLSYSYAHQPTHGHWSEYDAIIANGPPADRFPDSDRYVRKMVHGGYRSNEAMLNAIVDDIRYDLNHIEAFQVAAQTVYAADATRLADIDRYGGSAPTERMLVKRIEDNRFIIEQTLVALGEKITGYERALGDVMLASAREEDAAAEVEIEGLRRRTARLAAELRHTDGRYALSVPRGEGGCIDRSIARACY